MSATITVDDQTGIPYRWAMPDSDRRFHVELDDEGEVWLRTGECWTVAVPQTLRPEETRWLVRVWPSVMAAVEAMVAA